MRVPTVQRRLTDRVTIVRACTVTRSDAAGSTKTIVDQRGDWFELIADEFGLTFDGIAESAVDRLWTVVQAAHQARSAP